MMKKIEFKKTKEGSLNLWVYGLENSDNNKNRTAILWIHGGGWHSGDPSYFGDDYDYFTNIGAVNFGIEYTLVSNKDNDSNASKLYSALQDCIDAVKYVKENAKTLGIDPNKIVLVGESAGGHLALCFVTNIVKRFDKSIFPQAVIAYNPVIETLSSWSQSAAKYDGLSFNIDEFRERYKYLKNISPSQNIVKNNIPLLLLTGIDDRVVFPCEVVDFYERYIAVGNIAEIELYEKTTHAFALPDWYDKGMSSRDKSLETVHSFLLKQKLL